MGMDSSQDRELVAGVLARKPGAFAQLVERYQDLVWHIVYRMVQHPEDTRELAQEVFLRVHQRLAQYRFESSLATWIGRIAFNIAARKLERKRIPLVEPDNNDDREPLDAARDDFDLAAACENDELVGKVGEMLAELPPLQRSIVTLYYLDDLGVAEIARITGQPTGTIKSHLFRARRHLREQLEILTGESS